MGQVYADIELINTSDLEMVRRGYGDPDEVRRITIHALVDSGAFWMSINENLQELLQLPLLRKVKNEMADGTRVELELVGPLEIRFGDNRAICEAVILPGDSEPLLGVLPMEAMHVLIDPKRQELVPNEKLHRI